MASWGEIDRIRKNPEGFRSLARTLVLTNDLTEWEKMFLESIAVKTDVKEYTTRQSEKMLQIRDDAISLDSIRGFSVAALIRGCFEARNDLSEDDEQWIIAVRERGTTSINRKYIGRLMRCSRQLGLIEEALSE